jgi:hypothetical protein
MVAFEIVVIVVCVVSAVIATAAFIGARRLYDQIGRAGPFSVSPEDEHARGRRELRPEPERAERRPSARGA